MPVRQIDTESYQDFLRAKALMRGPRKIEPGGPVTQATKLLEKVVAKNPGYAPAWAGLGSAYLAIPNLASAAFNAAGTELPQLVAAWVPKAESAAREAIRLDPTNSDAYTALARVEAARFNFVQAEDRAKEALSLDPGNPGALYVYSVFLAATGNVKQSLLVQQRLLAAEPLAGYNVVTADIYSLNGQDAAAIKMLQAAPQDWFVPYNLAWVFGGHGRYGDAANELQKMKILEGPFSRAQLDDALRLLQSAPAPAAAKGIPRLVEGLSFIYLYVGAPTRVLESLKERLADGFVFLNDLFILWHPQYSAARKTEIFRDLVRKAGLVDYWRARGWPDLCHPVGADDFACE